MRWELFFLPILPLVGNLIITDLTFFLAFNYLRSSKRMILIKFPSGIVMTSNGFYLISNLILVVSKGNLPVLEFWISIGTSDITNL